MKSVSNANAKLGSLEWKVVDMALEDGPRSLKPQGFLARLSRDLFGLPVPQQLASDSLEALRRFCVRAWYWDSLEILEVRMLLEEGFSRSDIRRILAHIGAHRGFIPAVKEYPI